MYLPPQQGFILASPATELNPRSARKGLLYSARDLMTFYSLRLPLHKIMQTSEGTFLTRTRNPRCGSRRSDLERRSAETIPMLKPTYAGCCMLPGISNIASPPCTSVSGRITSIISNSPSEPTLLIPITVVHNFDYRAPLHHVKHEHNTLRCCQQFRSHFFIAPMLSGFRLCLDHPNINALLKSCCSSTTTDMARKSCNCRQHTFKLA